MDAQNRLAELEELYSGADWQAIFQDGGMDAVEEYAEYLEGGGTENF